MDLEISKLKEEIKEIRWDGISEKWYISSRLNQYSDYRTILLNLYQDYSPENPLYMHKEGIEQI